MIIDGIEFTVPTTGNHKYLAKLPDGKLVRFGDRRYQHYHDKIGKWAKLDHGNLARRAAYRARHKAIKTKSGQPAYKVKYSPAWFSYNYLW